MIDLVHLCVYPLWHGDSPSVDGPRVRVDILLDKIVKASFEEA